MTRDDLDEIARAEQEAQARVAHHFKVCVAASCLSSRSDQVKAALEREVEAQDVGHKCRVSGVGCLGLCKEGPLVSLESRGRIFQNVAPEDAERVVASIDGDAVAPLAGDLAHPFFTSQRKIALENSGVIDPERIEDYIAHGGYAALVDALSLMMPLGVVQQVQRSGLRGRGGGGYPTGLKWSTVAKARAPRKFVICNGDEGDPGAFMDRSVLESDPHRVVEGMTIAGYAVGASEGYIYVRAEYPLAVKRLKLAIKQAEKLGLLGQEICGTTFNFRIDIRLGAGAFVCGEETALIASVEGGRGTPRPRPPYPAEVGLWGMPTLINNVETFANVAPIVRNGGNWYGAIGTAKSKGTKVFALAGRVNNTGLIEVPMGITLRQVIFDIGGGIPEGRTFKAVQTGGPSGGCLPAEFLDMAVDYESLAKAGSIMGSGGMIVMDDTSCMVDVARYFMDFCMTESCGKCVPCRVGTVHLHDLLRRMTEGRATPADLDLLEQMCDVVASTSLCGLGQTAPNPVLSTLRYFRDEYLAHIVEKRCPAGVCQMHPEGEEVHA
jgi:bidirectional [NiFe] hydrogenase diaphorase subunit